MDKLLSIIEVAGKLNLSDKTLRRWEEAGRFTPTRTLGNQRRYSVEDLQILDAIKHGTIATQSDLLTLEQAAQLAGVSTASILRWENEGKIHPFITAANTYYPRERLLGKMAELKKLSQENNNVVGTLEPNLAHSTMNQSLSSFTPKTLQSKRLPRLSPFLINTCITLLLILGYHLFFAPSKELISPQTGEIQGVATSVDPRLDILEKKLADLIEEDKRPQAAPTETYTLQNATLITGTATLLKGSNQTSVINDQITQSSIITISFETDYAPAKKYWLTHTSGSFTLHTDFPVSSDSRFNYLMLQ